MEYNRYWKNMFKEFEFDISHLLPSYDISSSSEEDDDDTPKNDNHKRINESNIDEL